MSAKFFSNPYFRLGLIFVAIKIFLIIVMLITAKGDTKKAFLHWDGFWYQGVVDQGYESSFPPFSADAPECKIGSAACQRNFAFFPVYPLLVKAVTYTGIDSFLGGFVVSNIMYLAAVLMLYKLVIEVWPEKTGNEKKLAYLSVLAMLVFPSAYVFGVYMTESTFIFLLISGYYLAYKEKWLYAGLVGLMLSATRNTGILFALTYVLIWLEQNKFAYKKILQNKLFLLGLAVIPIGLMAFMVYLQNHVGDPLAFVHIQNYWGKARVAGGPIGGIIFSLYDWSLEASKYNHIYDISYLILCLALFALNLKKKWVPWSMSTILLWIVVPLTSGSATSLPRYAAVLFPIYILVPLILKNKKVLLISYYVLSFFGLIAFSIFYSKGYWITS